MALFRRTTSIAKTIALLVALLQTCALALPASVFEARHVQRSGLADEYDYVIVGGGTAGLTLADRLTEDPETTVLVVEYGYFDNSESVLAVEGGSQGLDPSRMFNLTSVPQENIGNPDVPVYIGCVVGGSSAVNGMVFPRGTAEDYDRFAELGAPGSDWSWSDLLPYFRKSVTFVPPEEKVAEEFNITWDIAAAYGGHTPVFAGWPTYQYPGLKIMWDAWKGYPETNFPVEGAAGVAGVYWFPNSMDPFSVTRSYARTGHYDGIHRENYHLITGHRVDKILLSGDGSVAHGVKISERNSTSPAIKVKAAKEVLLSAGTIHTPQVLQLSGIGPKQLLEDAGIKVRIDLPGVGQNFHDHSLVSLGYDYKTDVEPNPTTSLANNETFKEWADELWKENRTGPHSLGAGNAAAFLGLPVVAPSAFESIASAYETQDPAAHLAPNTDTTVIAGYAAQIAALAPSMRSKDTAYLEYLFRGSPGGFVINLHPVSRGSVNIASADPAADPLVDYRALSNPIDLDITVELVKGMRRYFKLPGMEQLTPVETAPGRNTTTDAQIREWVRATYYPTVYHPVGTAAKVPRSDGGVVDEELFVYGVGNLRVVDASIIPVVPGTHTSQTVYAIAEKAAELIKKRNGAT